jgi:hypothetical protein
LENSFTDLGGKTQSASQNFQSFATSMVGLVGSIASISSGVIGIAQGYTEMERAQTLVQRSSDRYQQALQTENNLRDKLNKLITEGKGGTEAAAKLEDQIALAHSKTATALETLNNNQSRANEVTATFYTTVIPQAVGIIGGLATAINTIPTAWDKIKSALQGTSIFGSLKADTTDIEAAQKSLSSSSNDVNTALNAEGAAANTAATGTRSLKTEALALAAPFIASAAAVVGFALGMQQVGQHAEEVHNFFDQLDTQLTASVPQVKGWASSFGDALASTGSFFNDNVKQIESWGGLNKSVMNASADEVQKYSDEFARSGQSESFYWDQRFKQWKQAADDSHKTYAEISKDNIQKIREDQSATSSAQQAADADAAAKKKQEDAAKHYADIVKDTSKAVQDDLTKSLDVLQQETTGVVKNWEQFGSSGTTVRTAFVDLNTAVQNTTKGLESHNQFANDTIRILTPLKAIASQVGGTFQLEYNAAMLAAIKVHNGVTDSIQPIIDHLRAMDDATHTVNVGINAQKDAFHAAGLAMIDTDGKLQQLEKTIQDGTQLQQSFAKGQQDAKQAMLDNESAIAKEAGSLKTYYDQIGTGRPLNDAFLKGFADQAKAFADQAVALADTQGKLSAYFEALQTGVPQLEAFIKGAQDQYAAFIQQGLAIDTAVGKQEEYFREIQSGAGVIQIQEKALADLGDAYIKVGEQLITQNTELSNSQALWERYKTDVLAGKSAVADFEIKLQDSKVQEDTQLTGLKAIADGIGGLPAVFAPTIQNYQAFIKANYDGGAAVIDFNLKTKKAWTDLTSAGDTFFSALIKAFGETGKTASDDFKKAFTDLPTEVQRLLTPKDQQSLAVQAAFAHAGDAAGQAFAIKAQAALDEGFSQADALKIGTQAAASIIQGFVQQHPQFASQAQQFFSVLSTGSAEQIKAALDQMAKMPGPLGEIAKNAQTALKPMFSELGTNAKTSVDTSISALTQLGLTVDKTTGQVTTATGQWVGSINPVTGAFTSANTSASNFAATVKGFGDISSAAQIVFQNIVTNANTMATNLGTSFRQMSTNAVAGFGSISSTAQTTFQTIGTQANTLATTIGTAFRQAATNAVAGFGSMASTAQTTFQTMGTQANTAASNIAGSFRQMATLSASSFGSLASTAQTTFNNMVNQAQAAARSIAAAFQQAFAAQQQGAFTPNQGAFAPQTGQAGQFTPFQGVFAQHGFVGVVDQPTQFVVGEAGPEYVSVIPGGSAGSIGNTMAVGLTNMVANILRTIEAMGFFLSASNRNTLSFTNSSLAADKNTKSLNDVNASANNNLIATNTNTVATTNSTTALNTNAVATAAGTKSILQIPSAANNTTTGLNGTTGAANGATSALGNMSNAMNQVPAQFADLMARMQAGVQASAFAGLAQYGNFSQGTPVGAGGGAGGGGGGIAGAPYGVGPFGAYAQYGNFSGQSPAAAPGAAYYGGPPTGGSGIQGAPAGVGAFGGLAQYGKFGGSQPAAAPGTAYYGGPPTGGGGGAIQGAPLGVGPFGGLAQYGQFSAGQQPSTGQPQQQSGQQGGGGIQGPQGGASSSQQQQPKHAASGFEGIVSRATAFIAGEAGPENVRVTPVSNIASSTTNDVNSILAMIAELVRQVTNQSLNINLSSYLDGYQVYRNQQKYTQGRTGNYLG